MPLVRRRPLLRAAGTAAVGAAAYHAGRRSEMRAQEPAYPPQEAAYPPQAPPPAGGLSAEAMAQLKELGQLHEQGILTDEEFEAQKQRLLQG